MTIPAERLTRCRGCGKRIMFIRTPDGKTVPLDVQAPIYHRIPDPDGGGAFWLKEERESAFVSHFATCSRANDFSGSGRKERG